MLVRSLLFLLPFSNLIVAQEAAAAANAQKCGPKKILDRLQANVVNGSDSWCQEFIADVSYIGTLREDPTLFFYETTTNTKSKDLAYAYSATSTRTVVTFTSYESQKRKSDEFTMPLPSYVQGCPTPAVSKGCTSLIGPGPTYTQYRNCEQANTTTTYSSTFTYTVGRPTSTSTFTETLTKTRSKFTTAPFPTKCPEANEVDYVATDKSAWLRYCNTGLNQYRELDRITTNSLTECIEKCVDYNTKYGFKQCQTVEFVARTKECLRANAAGYFSNPDGKAAVGILKFLPPGSTTGPDYCATVSGAA